MIKQVRVRYFKRFKDEVFDVEGNIVLAGPNNSGKSTLLQAIAVWNLALTKWLAEKAPETGSKAKKRAGVAITRKDFSAIPLREMKLLWTDCATSLFGEELEGDQKAGTPRKLEITISAAVGSQEWELPFQFSYGSEELVYASPSPKPGNESAIDYARELRIVHVPPFSGIGAEETRYDKAYQDLLIGQGKPGEILRNLLWEICEQDKDKWGRLCGGIKDIFSYELLPPQYQGRPFILCQYVPDRPILPRERGNPKLDISSAGSGFLQVLMLLGFFYARPATVLLLDEPDAHLHVILQSQIYDRLREVAARQSAQLMIATHSEVLIDNTPADKILTFFRRPHRLGQDWERDQVREALKRLTSLEIVSADQSPAILYTENESDLKILRAWASVLDHNVLSFFREPFWRPIHGRHPKEARDHFFALKAIKPEIRGILLLDGDNRSLPDHEVSAEGLHVTRWKRYEIESYLMHPVALERYVMSRHGDLFSQPDPNSGREFLLGELPPALMTHPLADHAFYNSEAISKTLLPTYLDRCRVPLPKSDYYLIAKQMLSEEIPHEVVEKLDLILKKVESPE
jgi:predicted ATPase